MAGLILDASALIAMLRDEPGGADVAAVVDSALISLVNYSEVVTHYARASASRAQVEAMLRPIPFIIVDVDRDLATDVGMLEAVTRSAGLSLGDRFCLALAKREGLPAWTSDRAWSKVAQAIGVDLKVIR